MTPNDRLDFLRTMNGMASVFGATLTAEALEVWWSAFSGWTIDEFKSVAAVAVRRAVFMPRPGDLTAVRKAAYPTAGEAWSAVLRHLRGGYRTGGLTAEIDRAVAPLGGYQTLAMMPAENLYWQEKRFTEHYSDLSEVSFARESLTYTVDLLRIQADALKVLPKL